MKLIRWLILSFLILSGLSPLARSESFRTDLNPAMIYYQAFLLAPNSTGTNYDYLFTNNWLGQPLTEHFGRAISAYDQETSYLHRAAAQKYPCDWGIDMSPGPETYLPELAYCKRAAQAACMHAMWKLQQGDEPAARDDVLGAFVVGRNAAHDGTLIAVLVQFAIESIVCANVSENFQHYSPATLQQLADGFAGAPERTSILNCLTAERFSSGIWLRDQIYQLQKTHPNDDTAVMEAVHQLINQVDFEDDTNYWQKLTNGAGGTLDGLIKTTQQSELFYERLTGIMALPHGEFEDQINQFNNDVKKSGDFITAATLDAWPNSRRKEFTGAVQLAMVRAAIAYKLHGDAGLQGIMDPLGNGPFTCERFVYQGIDRGFELKSAYVPVKTPVRMIFVEKDGPAFHTLGEHAGEPFTP